MSTEVILQLQASLQKFIDHVDSMKSEEDDMGNGLEAQFRELRDLTMKQRDDNTLPATEGRKQHNIKKNRYKDILPFDYTRVTLTEIPDVQGSDYINANFIEGFNSSYNYIASQGPLPNTVDDFWRMLWQCDIIVIFMACKLVELGKKKCEQYWPDEVDSKKAFGEIEVTLVKEENHTEHSTIRTLEAECNGEKHTLIQLHYTGWPDHDIPDDIDTILDLIAEMRRIRKEKHSVGVPQAVIHCSAGCGRTGTICAIDYAWDILKSGKLTEDFDLFEIIKHMREQRQSMIQTPDQYEMVFVATQKLFKKHLELIEDHEYGNILFQGNGNHGDDDNEAQGPAGDEPRKHSLGSEIEADLLSYGIKTTESTESIPFTVPPEEKPQKPQKPVTLIKETFEPQKEESSSGLQRRPSKEYENHHGNASDPSVHINSTVEMFEKKQTNSQSSTHQIPSRVMPLQPLQFTTTGNIERGKVTSPLVPTLFSPYSNEDLKIQQQHIVPHTYVNKTDFTAKPSQPTATANIELGKEKPYVNKPDTSSKTTTDLKKIDGKYVTTLLIGPKQTSDIKPTSPDAASKPLARLNLQDSQTYSYAAGNEIRTDTKNMDGYSYAVLDKDGSQETVNSISSAGKNVYSTANDIHNGVPPSSDAGLYAPLHKPSKTTKTLRKGIGEDQTYEQVQIGSGGRQGDEPPIPERGYLDDPPNIISNNSPTDNREKSKGFTLPMAKNWSSGSSSTSGSQEFGKRSQKNFKGPRPPPAEWAKGKH